MDDLNKLVKLISVRGLKVIPLLDLSHGNTSKEKMLFNLILSGECKAEDEAAAKLYNSTADDARFKMLKMRLRKKLFNHLFFLDFSNERFNVSHKFEQECNNLIHQAKVLIKTGEYRIAEKLLNVSLKLSREGSYTSLEVTILELLVLVYAETNNGKIFYSTKEALKHQRSILAYEQEAEEMYLTAKLELNKSVQSKKAYLDSVKKDLSRMRELWKLSNSFNVYNYYYKLNVWYHELIGDFKEIISIATESEAIISQNSTVEKRFDHRYNKYINVYAHLRAKYFTNGLLLAEKYQADFNRTTGNWFYFMENYFLLAMHSKNYESALQIYNEVVLSDFFKKINRLAHERWTLYRTYLFFVNPSPDLLDQFSNRNLLSSVPEYGRDKQGFNVAILIIQLMHYLQEQDLEALVYRMGYLRKYMGTHLKDSFSDRSRLFFKLLLITVKEELDSAQCRKKGKPIFDKLQDTPAPGDAYAEIEIIPYEHLWELALQIMEKKGKNQYVGS